MIIGGGIFQVPAIKEAQKMGYAVLVIDINPHAPGSQIADFFECISTKDSARSIICAREYNTRYCLKAVFTVGTDVSYTVASVAHALGVPGIPPEVALHATNKYLMRCRLSDYGIPCPRFFIAHTLDEARERAQHIGYPLVIKPVDNMGARGVRRIDDEDELRETFPKSIAYSGNYSEAAVILEEYMDGNEISMDTLVDENGNIHLLTVADRHIIFPPYFIEMGHSIPSVLSQRTIHHAFEVMKQAIRAIGITRGAAKVYMKITPTGPMICEMTARLSGGFHSQYTDPLATGMHSIKAALDIALGNPLDIRDITPQFSHAAIERALLPVPGKITAIEGIENARTIDGIFDVFITCNVGDVIAPFMNNVGKAGHIIAFGRDREKAEAAYRKARDVIHIKTVNEMVMVPSS